MEYARTVEAQMWLVWSMCRHRKAEHPPCSMAVEAQMRP